MASIFFPTGKLRQTVLRSLYDSKFAKKVIAGCEESDENRKLLIEADIPKDEAFPIAWILSMLCLESAACREQASFRLFDLVISPNKSQEAISAFASTVERASEETKQEMACSLKQWSRSRIGNAELDVRKLIDVTMDYIFQCSPFDRLLTAPPIFDFVWRNTVLATRSDVFLEYLKPYVMDFAFVPDMVLSPQRDAWAEKKVEVLSGPILAYPDLRRKVATTGSHAMRLATLRFLEEKFSAGELEWSDHRQIIGIFRHVAKGTPHKDREEVNDVAAAIVAKIEETEAANCA